MFWIETDDGRIGPFEFASAALMYAMVNLDCDYTIVEDQS